MKSANATQLSRLPSNSSNTTLLKRRLTKKALLEKFLGANYNPTSMNLKQLKGIISV